ncbi:hypothetical protein PL263_07525 [Methylomonas sp. EFPC3]|uniref:hypothetical protein n=1 Tax=Methylomonas sp. EFPC3 TaxID=3021710 RepID=UPI002417B7BC|nr:hypothetical protein [Methylomonas sp. EFPC3]WFP51872.1 hypothetical protein PL263_07525 [Methylomonas sp. EFPC3]
MKNPIHNIAKYIALILISALPFSLEAAADPFQGYKPTTMENNFDGELIEPPTVEDEEE